MIVYETIDGHSFCPGLLTENGWTIDAGCRGWNFAKHIVKVYNRQFKMRDRVYALDIENFSDEPPQVVFDHSALSHTNGWSEAYYFGAGDGNFMKGINEPPGNLPDRPCDTKIVDLTTLEQIYDKIGKDIDILKLDIEGSEYEILNNIEPIPRQITVEFHEHTVKKLHNLNIDGILDRLSKWYYCDLHIRDWPVYKYMDCLFIRKDLL